MICVAVTTRNLPRFFATVMICPSKRGAFDAIVFRLQVVDELSRIGDHRDIDFRRIWPDEASCSHAVRGCELPKRHFGEALPMGQIRQKQIERRIVAGACEAIAIARLQANDANSLRVG